MLSTSSRIQFISEPRVDFRKAATVKNTVLGSFDATQVLVARKWANPDELTAELVVPTGWALDHLPQKSEIIWNPNTRARYVSVTPPTGLTMIFLLTECDIEELDDENCNLSIKGYSPEKWLEMVPSTIKRADEALLTNDSTVADWVRLACQQYSLGWGVETIDEVSYRDLPIESTSDASVVDADDRDYYGVSSVSLDDISTSFTDHKQASLISDVSNVDSRPWPAPLGADLFKLEQSFPYTIEKTSNGATVEYRSEFELMLLPVKDGGPYNDGCLWWRWYVHPHESDVVYISRQAGSIIGNSTLHLTSNDTDALVWPPDYQETVGDGDNQTTREVTRRSQARFASTRPAMPGPWASVATKEAEYGQAKPESITAVDAMKQAAAAKAGLDPRITIDCTADGTSEPLQDITNKLRPGITAGLRFSNAVLTFPVDEVDYSFSESGWSIELPLTVKTNHMAFTYYGDDYDEYNPDDSFEGPGDTPTPPEPAKPLGGGHVDWISANYGGAYNCPQLLIKTDEQKLYAVRNSGAVADIDWVGSIVEVTMDPAIVEKLIPLGYHGGLFRAEGYASDFWVIDFYGDMDTPVVKHGTLPQGEQVVMGANTGSWIMTTACAYSTTVDSSGTELVLTPLESYPMIGTERVIQAGDGLVFVGKKQLWRWNGNERALPESLGLARGGEWTQVMVTDDGHVLAIDSQGVRVDGKADSNLTGVVGVAGNDLGLVFWKNDETHTLLIYKSYYNGDEPTATINLPFTPTGAVTSMFPTQESSEEPAQGISRGVVLYGAGGAIWLRNTGSKYGYKTLTDKAVTTACGTGSPYGTIVCTADGALIAPGTGNEAVLTTDKVVSCAGDAVDSLFNTSNKIVAVLVTESGKALNVIRNTDGSYGTDQLVASGAVEAMGSTWPCLYVGGDDRVWQVDNSKPLYDGNVTSYSYDAKTGYLTYTLENGDAIRYFPGGEVRSESQPQEGAQILTQHVADVTMSAGKFWGSTGEGWVGESPSTYTLACGSNGIKQVALTDANKAYHSAWLDNDGTLYWVSPDASPVRNDVVLTLKSSQLVGTGWAGVGLLSSSLPYIVCAYKETGQYRLYKVNDKTDFYYVDPTVETTKDPFNVNDGETILGVYGDKYDQKLYTNKAVYSYAAIDTAMTRKALLETISSVMYVDGLGMVAKVGNDLVALGYTYTTDDNVDKYKRITGMTGDIIPSLCSSRAVATTTGYWSRSSATDNEIRYTSVPVTGSGSVGTPLTSIDAAMIVTTSGLWSYGYADEATTESLFKQDKQLPSNPLKAVTGSNAVIVETSDGLYRCATSAGDLEATLFSGDPIIDGFNLTGNANIAAAITSRGELWYDDGARMVRSTGDYSPFTTIVTTSETRLIAAYGQDQAQSMRLTKAPTPFPCLMVDDFFDQLAPAITDLQSADGQASYYWGRGDATRTAGVLYNYDNDSSWVTSVYSSGIYNDTVGSADNTYAAEAIMGAVLPTVSSFTGSGLIMGGTPGELVTRKRADGERYIEFGTASLSGPNVSGDHLNVLHQLADNSIEILYPVNNDDGTRSYGWHTVTALPSSHITEYYPHDQAAEQTVLSFDDGSLWLVIPATGSDDQPQYVKLWNAGVGSPRDVNIDNNQPRMAISPDGSYVVIIAAAAGTFYTLNAPDGKTLSTCKGLSAILGTDGTLYYVDERDSSSPKLDPTEDPRFYKAAEQA